MNRDNPNLFQQWVQGGQKEIAKLIKDVVVQNADNETRTIIEHTMDNMIIRFFGKIDPSDVADSALTFLVM